VGIADKPVFRFAPMALRQTRSGADLTIGLRYRRRKYASDPLGVWGNGTAPGRRGFRQSDRERSHQTTVAVTLLEEPFSPERFARDPVRKKGIHLWANGFHEIASQTVTMSAGCPNNGAFLALVFRLYPDRLASPRILRTQSSLPGSFLLSGTNLP
jgi:hypothetical protein